MEGKDVRWVRSGAKTLAGGLCSQRFCWALTLARGRGAAKVLLLEGIKLELPTRRLLRCGIRMPCILYQRGCCTLPTPLVHHFGCVKSVKKFCGIVGRACDARQKAKGGYMGSSGPWHARY